MIVVVLLLLQVPVDCRGPDCPPPALGWDASASMQSGDVLLVRIDNQPLTAELDKLLQQGKVSTRYVYTHLMHESVDKNCA